jgi:AP-4 complex subunit mu-1
MNYRVTGDFQPPFRLFPYIEEPSNYKLEMNLRIKSVYPKEYIGSAVEIKFPVPKAASSVHTELPKVYLSYNLIRKGTQGQEAEFKQSENMVVWVIKKFPGNTELSLKTKVTLQTGQNTMSARKELGPIR